MKNEGASPAEHGAIASITAVILLAQHVPSCVLHPSHHLTYPQPHPTDTISTGAGSHFRTEATKNDARRLKCRLEHHQGKHSQSRPSSTHPRMKPRHEEMTKIKAAKRKQRKSKAAGVRVSRSSDRVGRIPSRPFLFIPRRPAPWHLSLPRSSTKSRSASSRDPLRLLTNPISHPLSSFT